MKRIILIVVLLFFISCDKDDISPTDNLIDGYFMTYMDYDPSSFNIAYIHSEEFLIKLEYSGNKVIKKKGDYLPSLIQGTFGFFSQDIFDEVSYSKNKIIIEKKSFSLIIYPSIRTIELNNEGYMIKKTIPKILGVSGGDTIIDNFTKEYVYNSQKLLTETYLTKRVNYSSNPNNLKYYENALFYYNADNNLDSIITIRQSYDEINDNYISTQKVVEIFSDYDNASNPTRNLNIFEETFNRSLSKNNYSSYTKNTYLYSNGILNPTPSSVLGKNWTYAYDEEGNIRLDL